MSVHQRDKILNQNGRGSNVWWAKKAKENVVQKWADPAGINAEKKTHLNQIPSVHSYDSGCWAAA